MGLCTQRTQALLLYLRSAHLFVEWAQCLEGIGNIEPNEKGSFYFYLFLLKSCFFKVNPPPHFFIIIIFVTPNGL